MLGSVGLFQSMHQKTTSDAFQDQDIKEESISMMIWITEEFPPVVNTRPMMSVSRENMFSGTFNFHIHIEFHSLIFRWRDHSGGQSGQKCLQSGADTQCQCCDIFSSSKVVNIHWTPHWVSQDDADADLCSLRRVSYVRVVAIQAVDVAMFASGYFKVN